MNNKLVLVFSMYSLLLFFIYININDSMQKVKFRGCVSVF